MDNIRNLLCRRRRSGRCLASDAASGQNSGAVPVLAAPQTASGKCWRWTLRAAQWTSPKRNPAAPVYLMSRDLAVREESYRAICAQLEGLLSRGQDVAMVNLGDVSIYATAYYIFDRLQKAGFPAKMVPGITSFSAVAAQLGWSLTDGECAASYHSPEARTLQAALHLPGTKVLMKSGSALGDTVAALEKVGLLDRAALVCDCGLPTQKIYRDLRHLPNDLSYFATIVVRGGGDLMQASVPGWFLPERTAAAANDRRLRRFAGVCEPRSQACRLQMRTGLH